MPVTIKSAYNRPKSSGIDTGEGITEQGHKDECDINRILRDYSRTGFIKHAKNNQGRYDDVNVQDFQDAMFLVKNAQNMFNELPGLVRKRFNNDPAAFLEFTQNPANKAEMENLGILKGNDGIDVSGAAVSAPVETPKPPPATVDTPVEPKS